MTCISSHWLVGLFLVFFRGYQNQIPISDNQDCMFVQLQHLCIQTVGVSPEFFENQIQCLILDTEKKTNKMHIIFYFILLML